MQPQIQVTVVVLCRNNPAALMRTLTSACAQQPSCDVLVVDGSDDNSCQRIVQAMKHGGQLLYLDEPAAGPYAAMNRALAAVTTRWVHFLHSGDLFLDPSSLGLLVSRAEALRTRDGKDSAAVFGQAWIEAPAPSRWRWLSPDPQVQQVLGWLRHMVPCHQAVLFSTAWAQRHPYDTRNSVCADRPLMRQALASSGTDAYVRQPVCRFRLDGLSSQLPDWDELRRRWREPAHHWDERLGELGKFLLRPLGRYYALLMWIRSRGFGWLYR
jgi:hypothetical protein